MNYIPYLVNLILLLAPGIVWAQSFRDVVFDITDLLRSLIPVLVGAAVLVFFVGLTEYIYQAGDKSAVETGKNRMIAGVIGLVVISAIWGIVAVVGNTFGLGINPV